MLRGANESIHVKQRNQGSVEHIVSVQQKIATVITISIYVYGGHVTSTCIMFFSFVLDNMLLFLFHYPLPVLCFLGRAVNQVTSSILAKKWMFDSHKFTHNLPTRN